MGTTAVQLVLETRGQDHANQVLTLLAKRGYSVTTEQ